MRMTQSKYRNRRTTVDGVTYDSAKEARRGAELRLLERAGKIQDLCAQVKYTLIPAQKRDGKVIERAVTYIADFVYKEYIIKRKLMLWEYGIQVREV